MATEKRLLNELKRYNKSGTSLENGIIKLSEGLYLKTFEDDIKHYQGLVIGPDETPYENGMFVFDIEIPYDYPNSPPKVKFLTTDGVIRFNPNYYACGKVCLSILGTWSGPGWEATMNLETVMNVLHMTFTEIPLQNEPGYQDRKDAYMQDYSEIVRYHTYNYAIINNLKNYNGFFKDIMKEEFNKRIPKIMENITKLKDKFSMKPITQVSYHSQKAILDYELIEKKIKELNL